MSSREKILEAALEQFYKKGYLATSVDDIIAQANVSKSNFYYHFKSKEDLGITVLEMRSEELSGVLGRTLCNEGVAPSQRLIGFLDFLIETQEARFEKGGCPFGNLVAEMAEHSERFRCHLSSMFGSMSAHIAEVLSEGQQAGEFRRDIEAGELASLFVQTIQGMLLMTKCHKSVDSLGSGARVLMKLISA
jgi:TetR/AcrR family transcriptional regulator, transcriptional repressor for nem operon